jgi:hypothetical protein
MDYSEFMTLAALTLLSGGDATTIQAAVERAEELYQIALLRDTKHTGIVVVGAAIQLANRRPTSDPDVAIHNASNLRSFIEQRANQRIRDMVTPCRLAYLEQGAGCGSISGRDLGDENDAKGAA